MIFIFKDCIKTFKNISKEEIFNKIIEIEKEIDCENKGKR